MAAPNAKVAGIIAGIVLLLSLAAVFKQLHRSSPRIANAAWFYDLNTKELFAAPINAIPPIAAPSGPLPDGQPAGVKAHVYGCGDCTPAHRSVAYLETYTPDQRDQLLRWQDRARRIEPPKDGQPFVPSPDFAAVLSGDAAQLKRPDDADWVARGSPEGKIVAGTLPPCSGGVVPQECVP